MCNLERPKSHDDRRTEIRARVAVADAALRQNLRERV